MAIGADCEGRKSVVLCDISVKILVSLSHAALFYLQTMWDKLQNISPAKMEGSTAFGVKHLLSNHC